MTTQAAITIYQEERIRVCVQVLDQEGGPRDVTGATIEFRIGDRRDDIFLFKKEGVFTTDGSDGRIQVDILAAESATFDVRTWNFQFIITDDTRNLQVIEDGIICVKNLLPRS